jgi:hypothetical protein
MRFFDRSKVCIWTPPRLQAIRLQAVRYDCSRISGLVLLHLLKRWTLMGYSRADSLSL